MPHPRFTAGLSLPAQNLTISGLPTARPVPSAQAAPPGLISPRHASQHQVACTADPFRPWCNQAMVQPGHCDVRLRPIMWSTCSPQGSAASGSTAVLPSWGHTVSTDTVSFKDRRLMCIVTTCLFICIST